MKNTKTHTWSINIAAPALRVHDVMLGLSDKATYEQWVTVFSPSSSYEGTWDKGSNIRFVGKDEQGKVQGMVAEVVENIPGKFVSLRHFGMIDGEKEITEGPAVETWAGGFENYTLAESDGGTTVTVDVDLPESEAAFFNDIWPKALQKLKEIAEQ